MHGSNLHHIFSSLITNRSDQNSVMQKPLCIRFHPIMLNRNPLLAALSYQLVKITFILRTKMLIGKSYPAPSLWCPCSSPTGHPLFWWLVLQIHSAGIKHINKSVQCYDKHGGRGSKTALDCSFVRDFVFNLLL